MNEIQTMSPILPLWGDLSEEKTGSASESQGPTVPTARSLQPASDSVSPSLSASPPLMLCLCLSKINIKKR